MMEDAMDINEPGSPHQAARSAFVSPPLSSPAPSTAFSTSTTGNSQLPRPRGKPLKPGSQKETVFINYVDEKILAITRRYAKRVGEEAKEDATSAESRAVRGYHDFNEVAHDLDAMVDVIWVGGTPALQVPYLLSLALLLSSYLPDFTFRPKPTFRLIRKLDLAFASLLQGEDLGNETPLPGFEGLGYVISMTDKVRIKSVVERTRVAIVEAMEKTDPAELDAQSMDEPEEDEMEDEPLDIDEDEGNKRWQREMSKVYEQTIQKLGDELSQLEGL